MSYDKEQQLITWLTTHPEIELAVLFGSYAKGTAQSHSDIDLAIQLAHRQTLQPQQKMAYLIELDALVKTPVDLIDLTTAGQPLLGQIMKYGKLLKGNTRQYAELAIRNINSTEDFMPYLERMMTARRKRWLQHG